MSEMLFPPQVKVSAKGGLNQEGKWWKAGKMAWCAKGLLHERGFDSPNP